MRKSLIGTLFLGSVATLALTGCAGKMKPFAANYFTTNPNPLEAIGGKIPAVVTVISLPNSLIKTPSSV